MNEDAHQPARCDGAERFCIVISGCSGSGKSSLIAELAARGYLAFPEPGREIVKEQLAIGGSGLPWADSRLFGELIAARTMGRYNSLGRVDRPVFFDRGLVDSRELLCLQEARRAGAFEKGGGDLSLPSPRVSDAAVA